MNISDLHRRVQAQPPVGLLLDRFSQNLAFAYSFVKLTNDANFSIRAKNTVTSAEADIGFDGLEIDNNAIETLANGQLTVSNLIYNQKGSFNNNLTADDPLSTPAVSDNLPPILTDSSGNSFGYADFPDSTIGYGYGFINVPANPIPPMTNDYIITGVFRNESDSRVNRSNILIKPNNNNNFAFQTQNTGSLVRVSYIADKSENSFDGSFDISLAENANWYAITFSHIGGVIKAYFNSEQRTINTSVGGNVGMSGQPSSITINRRIGAGQSRQNNFKSAIMYYGTDLSSFPIQDYLDQMVLTHNL